LKRIKNIQRNQIDYFGIKEKYKVWHEVRWEKPKLVGGI
jgi:hypothetical protein